MYATHTQVGASGWDPLAYKYAGEQLATGQPFAYCHPYNVDIGPYFTMAGFNVQANDSACLFLNYPPGFPLLLAVVQYIFSSPDAAWYVPAVSATFGLLGVFAIGRALFDRWVGLLATIILAFTPTYLTFGTSLWSDVPGVVAMLGGLALYLWMWRVHSTELRWTLAVISGALVVQGLFTRYVNVLMLVPWIAYVLFSQKWLAFKRAPNWVFGTVVLAGVVGILLFNRRYYGGYLSTPYSPEHGWYTWPAFSLRYVLGESPVGKSSLLAVARTVWDNFSWLLVLAGWGIAHMRGPQRVLTLGSVLIFAVLYAGYAFPAQGINARFLLPLFPYVSLAAGFGLCTAVSNRWLGWWRGVGAVLVLVVLIVPLPGRLRGLVERNISTVSYVESVKRLVENSEPDAVFLAYNCNDAIAYYGRRTTLFYRRIPLSESDTGQRSIESPLVASVYRLLEKGISVYYVKDSHPPIGNSFLFLKKHYRLSQLEENAEVYQVLLVNGYP